jgi:branched-chain amino acid transport system permease protein
LPEAVRRFSEYQDLAYGALLILILIYAPGGLASLSRVWSRKTAREDA